MKKYIYRIALFTAFVFAVFLTTNAQQNMLIVADTNLQDCSFSKNIRNINIKCNINNNMGAQGGVILTYELVRKSLDSNNSAPIEYIYRENKVFSLREKESLPTEVNLIIPDNYYGDYKLIGKLTNQKGLGLSINEIADIKLEKSNKDSIEIFSESCYLHISGEDKKYTLLEGVDIKTEEKLFLNCEFNSSFKENIDAQVNFETRKRDIYTDEILDSKKSSINIKSGKSSFDIELPKLSTPQAYNTLITLQYNNKNISNIINTHYIIAGPSATIQNINLDKSIYYKGDVAKALIVWSGSADRFPDSRLASSSVETYSKLTTQILDGKNEACSDKVITDIVKNKSSVLNLEIKINKDCFNPKVISEIIDNNNKVLDSWKVELNSDPISIVNVENNNKLKIFGLGITYATLYGIVAIIISFIIIFTSLMFYKKKGENNLINKEG